MNIVQFLIQRFTEKSIIIILILQMRNIDIYKSKLVITLDIDMN